MMQCNIFEAGLECFPHPQLGDGSDRNNSNLAALFELHGHILIW